MNKLNENMPQNANPMHVLFLTSNEIIRATQRECKYQRRQDTSAGLVSCRNGVRENAWLVFRAATGIGASVRVADTLSAGIARVRRLQIADSEHVHADGRERAHLLSDAV